MNDPTGNSDSPVSPGAYSDLVSGIEEKVSDSENTPWMYFAPTWAQDRGADPPPDGYDSPVWAPETGWVEKRAAREDTGTPLCLYAPDSIGPETAASDQ
jgi:hypothetical protein